MITHLPVTVAGPWCDTRLAAVFLIIADVLDVRFEHLFNYDSKGAADLIATVGLRKLVVAAELGECPDRC